MSDLKQHDLHRVKRSADTGSRSLYIFEHQGQAYWLKLQEYTATEKEHWRIEGFEQEINFYRRYSEQKWVLPHQILNVAENRLGNLKDAKALILASAQPALQSLTAESMKDEIVHQIFLMIHALQGLHEKGWIHADLKKQHFVRYQQNICLLDFEQVQTIGDLNTNTHATPYYMAPELFHGAMKTVQTDLYALGIILLEWLSGTRLQAKSYEDWAILHCQSLQIQLPDEKRCFYPLLERLLARPTHQRFADIYAVQRFLMTEIA